MNYILFDDSSREALLPLTFVRPIADIRIGILTIREKWEKYLETKTSSLSATYLQQKFPLVKKANNILINGSVCPTPALAERVRNLKPNEALIHKDYIIAMYISEEHLDKIDAEESEVASGQSHIHEISCEAEHFKLSNTWEIFLKNGEELKRDFELITKGRISAPISQSNNILAKENVFLEDGVCMEFATINATEGPVYIGENATVMEGSVIRGLFALGEYSQLKIGAKIYGPTTIGAHCKVGGEVHNSVIFGYSNKAHDGYMGNSVIGEWCNLGADTNTSNLKNNYDNIRLWNYAEKTFSVTGEQFIGLIMGDHSKCGINTMFNTGTVVGVSSNIYGAGFQRNFIPSFSWGSPAGMKSYRIDKAIQTAKVVYERRKMDFDQCEQDILTAVYNQTFAY
ncbi:MAG: GlmU family protein [Bacteroidales bacterium]|nr:GlmU family protein [Bacteroidales bacterium]